MRAGELRHRITLQRATEARDSFGQAVKTWSDVATVWASVEPLRGREFLDARQLQREISAHITIRWRDDVDAGMRVRWTDPAGTAHLYDIEAVLPDATHRRVLTLMCVEAS